MPEVPSAGVEDAVQKVLRWPETALQAPDHVAGSTPLPRDAGFAGLRWPPSACTVPWPTINLTPWPTDPVLEILSSRFAPHHHHHSAQCLSSCLVELATHNTFHGDCLSPRQPQSFPEPGTGAGQAQTLATGSALPRQWLSFPYTFPVSLDILS